MKKMKDADGGRGKMKKKTRRSRKRTKRRGRKRINPKKKWSKNLKSDQRKFGFDWPDLHPLQAACIFCFEKKSFEFSVGWSIFSESEIKAD